jgi:hypothetical protein
MADERRAMYDGFSDTGKHFAEWVQITMELLKCYNDIVKLIIDFIPAKHNMSKDLYQSNKIVFGLRINYKKIDACEKIACCFRRSTRTTPNVCTTVDPNT